MPLHADAVNAAASVTASRDNVTVPLFFTASRDGSLCVVAPGAQGHAAPLDDENPPLGANAGAKTISTLSTKHIDNHVDDLAYRRRFRGHVSTVRACDTNDTGTLLVGCSAKRRSPSHTY